MNEVLDAIAKRFSCRSFTDQVPSDDDLQLIAQAAIQAPSAMNAQPWRIIMVKDKTVVDAVNDAGLAVLEAQEDKTMYDRIMERGGKMLYDAPCMVVVATPNEISSGYPLIDLGIVVQNVVLAAESLGINSVHVGMAALGFNGPQGEQLKKLIHFPADHQVKQCVLLGYAKESKAPHEPDQSKITWTG